MALSKSPYRGTRDFFPADMRLRNFIFQKWAKVSELYAYEPYDGPLLEEVALYLAKSGEELINEQIYSFMDRGERNVAIRPEMTPTVARMVAQIHREVAKPLRWYAIPNLMRYEKPQKGRLREFWQYNADIFGAGRAGELEIIQLAVSLMKSFGATASHFEILVNDRRFVDAVFKEALKLTPEQASKLYKVVDKVRKVSDEAVKKMTGEIIADEATAAIFYEYLKLSTWEDLHPFIVKHKLEAFTNDFYAFAMSLSHHGLKEFVVFDPTIVRGLDYYTSVVFEIFDKHPDNNRAIAGGGAYANLLQIFNEPALEGVGFGMGEVPMTEFLKAHGLLPDFSKPEHDVLVAYLDGKAEHMANQAADELRALGLKTELFLGEAKPKKVFTHTERKNFKFVVFIGEDELNKNELQIKNLKTKDVHMVPLKDRDQLTKLLKGNS